MAQTERCTHIRQRASWHANILETGAIGQAADKLPANLQQLMQRRS